MPLELTWFIVGRVAVFLIINHLANWGFWVMLKMKDNNKRVLVVSKVTFKKEDTN